MAMLVYKTPLQLVHDETMRLGISVISQAVSIFYIVINVLS